MTFQSYAAKQLIEHSLVFSMLGIVPGLVPDTDKLGAIFSFGSARALSHTWDIVAFSAEG